MIRFTAIRLVEIAAMLVLMSFVIYGLIGLMPGDPIDLMMSADPHLTAASKRLPGRRAAVMPSPNDTRKAMTKLDPSKTSELRRRGSRVAATGAENRRE